MSGIWHSARVAGHFGEFVQGRIRPGGPVALITLPCDALAVDAAWSAGRELLLYQHGRPVISRECLVALFRRLRGGPPVGRLRIRAGMPPGGGAGASTASLLAASAAITRGGFARLPWEAQAEFCIGLEGASDPLMLGNADRQLWASRRGCVLGEFPAPPRFEIVGGFLDKPIRTDPADDAFADVADLIARWGDAVTAGDHAATGAVASESARRNARTRKGPGLEPIEALAARLGAVGVVAAHTGSARGLLFRPGTAPAVTEDLLRETGLHRVLRFSTGGGSC